MWAAAATCLVVCCCVDPKARLGCHLQAHFFSRWVWWGASVPYCVAFHKRWELDVPESIWSYLGSICVSGVCTSSTVMHIGACVQGTCVCICQSTYVRTCTLCLLSRHGLWSVCGSAEWSQNFNMQSPGPTTFGFLVDSEDGRGLVSQVVLRGSPTCCF